MDSSHGRRRRAGIRKDTVAVAGTGSRRRRRSAYKLSPSLAHDPKDHRRDCVRSGARRRCLRRSTCGQPLAPDPSVTAGGFARLGSGGSGSQVNQAAANLRRINIALYGYGGDGHDGSYLSDSIMVVSIQPRATGPPQVSEISIPRDWEVPINLGTAAAPRIHYAKINEAYADGMSGESTQFGSTSTAGHKLADQTLENLLRIHIDHYIGLDFYVFKDAVDAVGGVNVNVQNTFTDYQYPAGECNGDYGENCGYMTVHFDAGPQHMNGARALIFSRSRHANGWGPTFSPVAASSWWLQH